MRPPCMRVKTILLLVAIPASAIPLLANGGTLRIADAPMGAYRVSVFTDPTPIRPDEVDVSVLVLQEGVVGVAEGLEVTVRARSLEPAAAGPEVRATREQADDPRYYAAKFSLGYPGRWEFAVDVRGPAGGGSASFEATVRDPGILSHPLALILLSLIPLVAVAWWLLREETS